MSQAERQARWRKSTSRRRVELYLSPAAVAWLDAAARDAACGRAGVIESMIKENLSPVDASHLRGVPRVYEDHRYLRQIPTGRIYIWTEALVRRPDMENYEPPPRSTDAAGRHAVKG